MWKYFGFDGFLLPTRSASRNCLLFDLQNPARVLCVGIFIPLPLSSAPVETKLPFEGLVLRFSFGVVGLFESNFSGFAWLGLFLDQQKKNDDD